MSGVYVRKTSWLDWTQKGKNSILTIPGSYWLCHKSNVYKFIFRYHRVTRNVKQFNFGKELMKVVRRVIKNQPRQGQQFSTKHLLITYTYASWTRQDKMFALIKFKERSVAVFSHAFVLTVKLCCPSENIDQNTKYLAANPDIGQCLVSNIETSNSAHLHENKIKRKSEQGLLHSCTNDILEKNAQSESTQNTIIELNNESVSSDDSLKKLFINKNSVKQKTNNVNIGKFIQKKNSISLHNTSDMIKEDEGVDTHNSNDLTCLKNESNTDKKVHVKITELSNNSNKLIESDKDDIKKKSIGYKPNLTLSNSNDKSTVDIINTDSVNLPYQYLIEKEIENAKHKEPDFQNCLQETNNNKSPCNQQEENSKKHKLSDVNENTKDLFSPKKRKVDKASRSSDITDLVMEGLMFTIRQEEDTVAVIEQKTKLEMDEVLENSEKIETKEGEKCLRNSSLLGLENLITMIDSPQQVGNEQKCQSIGIRESVLRNQSNNIKQIFNDSIIRKENITPEMKHMLSKSLGDNFASARTSLINNIKNFCNTNRSLCLTIHDDYKFQENMNFINHKKLDYHEEEKEDIIPEALQNIFQSSVHSLQEVYEIKEKCIQNKNVITNNEKELMNPEIMNDKCTSVLSKTLSPKRSLNTYSSNNEVIKQSVTNQLHELCVSNVKNGTGVPTITSNQTVTLKEIPLPLQKMLKKTPIKCMPSINENKINKSNVTVPEEEGKIALNIQSENKILDNENNQNNDDNENVLSTTSEIEMKDIGTSERSQEKMEKVLTDKIKDITQEFHQDLSYLQKQKPLDDKKFLRSRAKSLNVLGNESYGDTHIEMVKLFQDITRGAKVVVTRISTKKCS